MSRPLTFRQAFAAEFGAELGRLAVLGVVGVLLLVPWLVSEHLTRREMVRKIHEQVDEVRAAANGT